MNAPRRKRRLGLAVLLAWASAALGFSFAPQGAKPTGPVWNPTKVPAGTEFVGNQACAECHKSKARVHAASAMGRALEPVAEAPILSSHARLTFKQGKYAYEIVRQGKQSIFTVTDGVATVSEPILYSFGQGKAGQTYVLSHDGQFYESRVSFYNDTQALDITIGHDRAVPPSLIESVGRRMSIDETQQCFSCHSTNAASGGRLHLDRLLPGVTCESCHGPGGAHVAAGRAGEESRDKIFNPARLGGDDVSQEFCGSCHRGIEKVIARPQDGVFNVRFQPYRIFNSKCYSDDRRVSCIACHDAHDSLKHDAAFYDAKCMACHQVRNTKAVPVASKTDTGRTARACKVEAKNCASCHMPKVELPGAHFKFTDHRIRVARPGDPYPN